MTITTHNPSHDNVTLTAPVEVISALQPPPPPRHIDIVVHVREDTMATRARTLQDLFDGSRDEDLSERDMHLMAGAFATLAGWLPIGSYDLVKWIATCGMFDDEYIREYAEDHLGMQRIAAPVICNAASVCGIL